MQMDSKSSRMPGKYSCLCNPMTLVQRSHKHETHCTIIYICFDSFHFTCSIKGAFRMRTRCNLLVDMRRSLQLTYMLLHGSGREKPYVLKMGGVCCFWKHGYKVRAHGHTNTYKYIQIWTGKQSHKAKPEIVCINFYVPRYKTTPPQKKKLLKASLPSVYNHQLLLNLRVTCRPVYTDRKKKTSESM